MSADLLGYESTQNLIDAIQHHVPWQPWGSYGNEPVPVSIQYCQSRNLPRPPWTVTFVVGLNSTKSKRQWGTATGETLEAALVQARRMQREN